MIAIDNLVDLAEKNMALLNSYPVESDTHSTGCTVPVPGSPSTWKTPEIP